MHHLKECWLSASKKFTALILIIAALVSCQEEFAMITLQVGDSRFEVSIARTVEDRGRGLMFRTDLGPREGMLFVFDDDEHRAFWMKNTPLPLSIAFLSADGKILQIESLVPYSEMRVRSRQPSRYALELNAGAFEEVGAEVGDVIRFPRNWN